jgi:N-acetylglucosamine malate deacetylase 1
MTTKTALAVMAHPDDAEMCMGGTLAAFARAGWRVLVLIASIPDKRDERIAEARAGADILGVELRFLDVGPSEWQVEDLPTYRLTAAVDEVVRELDPRMLFSHWIQDAHFDHVRVGRAAQAASRYGGRDIYMCEQPNVSAANAGTMPCNTYVDVTETLQQCLAGLRAHTSQVSGRSFERMIEARAAYRGLQAGCTHAEGFYCVRHRLVP